MRSVYCDFRGLASEYRRRGSTVCDFHPMPWCSGPTASVRPRFDRGISEIGDTAGLNQAAPY
jgi:hypothetical protein